MSTTRRAKFNMCCLLATNENGLSRCLSPSLSWRVVLPAHTVCSPAPTSLRLLFAAVIPSYCYWKKAGPQLHDLPVDGGPEPQGQSL